MATRLTDKLLKWVYRALNKDPQSYIAFRAQHVDGHFSYEIVGYTITCYVDGAQVFNDDLSNYTLLGICEAIGSLTGVSIVFRLDSASMSISARVLTEGSGDQAQSNGDCFYAYNSLLWMYFDAVGDALVKAGLDIEAMIQQMNMKTAEDVWLDYWGDQFGVARENGELDAAYSTRIVVEVLRPRGNGKAIEAAFFERFGQRAQVVDVSAYRGLFNSYDGTFNHDGSKEYDGVTASIYYGLFTVVIGYDILGADSPNDFATTVRAFVEKFRDAGNQMQSLGLSGSLIIDAYPGSESETVAAAVSLGLADTYSVESESMAPIDCVTMASEVGPGASDDCAVEVESTTTYNGGRKFSGSVRYQSGVSIIEVWS